MGEKLYLAMLHKIGISQKKLHKIFKNNCDFKGFYEKLNFNSCKEFGFSTNQIEIFLENKKKFTFKKLEKDLLDRDAKIIYFGEMEYPDFLKEIPNSPFIFYLRGKIDNSPKISVVGSRKISSYGINVINKIVGDLSKYFVIVSGGAAGCDSEAHKIALNNGNKTISVIGTGIDIDYPVGNKKLYDNIVLKGGGIISIFPVGEVGNPYNFPVRNEVVAGLSMGVLVVEAREKSGTMITSKLALDLGKDLFSVPGDIFKVNSIGTNLLIKKGMAKPTTCAEDILVEYNILNIGNKKESKTIKFSDEIEKQIYDSLILDNLTINELSRKNGLDISTLSFKLSMMEINGIIKKSIGGKYEVF